MPLYKNYGLIRNVYKYKDVYKYMVNEKIENMKAFEKELAVLFDEPEDDIENDPKLKLLIEKGLIK